MSFVEPATEAEDSSDIQTETIINAGQHETLKSASDTVSLDQQPFTQWHTKVSTPLHNAVIKSRCLAFVLAVLVLQGALLLVVIVEYRDVWQPQNNAIAESQIVHQNSPVKRTITHRTITEQQRNDTQSVYERIGLGRNKDKQIVDGIAKKRVSLAATGQNEQAQEFITLWQITNAGVRKDSPTCMWVNSIPVLTPYSLLSYKQLLADDSFDRLVIFTKASDPSSFKLIQSTFQQEQYQITQKRTQVDSDFHFIAPYVQQCHKVVYGLGHYQLLPSSNAKMQKSLREEVQNLSPSQMYYTSTYLYRQNATTLPNLLQTELSAIEQTDFSLFLYIFDPKLMKLMTPLNFAYFAKYTLQQILIVPMLALLRNSGSLKTSHKLLHRVNNKIHSYQYFKLAAPPVEKQSLCYVSYPFEPVKIDQAGLLAYVKSIAWMNSKNVKASVVIYLPLNELSKVDMLSLVSEISRLLQEKAVRIRIRFRQTKVEASFAVYEATYSYCPDKTVIVSSRHNIIFNPLFGDKVINSITAAKHYYFTQLITDSSRVIKFNAMPEKQPAYKLKYGIRKSKLFIEYFRYMQIFKSDFMKTNVFWILKSEEIGFYETEAPFVTLMMQQIKLRFKYIPQVLATVAQRDVCPKQRLQIRNVQSYGEFSVLINNKLMPYTKNCLENPIFRRYAPYRMPMKIHQVWFSHNNISEVRMKLHETFILNNPESTVRLWKLEDVTKENFPIFYNQIIRVLEANKEYPTSIMAMAADLARYEIIYNQGGIYADFKMESKKPLTNFFKYEALFIDIDVEDIRFNDPKVFGNGVMGAVQNSPHVKIVITQLIYDEKLIISSKIPFVTGSYILRKAFSYSEVFTLLGFGAHLFFPLPYSPFNACINKNKTISSDQVGYQIGEFKFGLPCKEYPESYLVNYSPLAKTWKKKASQTIN